AAWLEAHPEEAMRDRGAEVRWNGEALWRGAVRDTVGPWRVVSVPVPAGKLKPGPNTLELRPQGAAPLYWSVTGGANVPSPGPLPDRAKVTLEREYLRATRTADRRGRVRWLTTPLVPSQPLQVGEAVMVRLTLHTDVAPRRGGLAGPQPRRVASVDRPWDTAGEDRGDRAAFFLGYLDAGETRVEYLLRPEIAGTFTALPASAALMYDPTVATRSGEAKLRVVAP